MSEAVPPPSNERAIAVVRDLAAARGFDTRPSILADRSHLVLRLDPHPLVARVAMATSMARVGLAFLRREVSIARFLDARGVAVTRPTTRFDPGPIEAEGLVVSFWELERVLPGRPDPRAAGRELAHLHRALRAYPADALEPWGAWTEARAVFERVRKSALLSPEELALLEEGFAEADALVAESAGRSRSFQPVHGDAHIGNTLATERGVLFTDFEDAFVGPLEYDLASLRSKLELFGEEREAIEAMCEAYDEPYDAELVRALGLVRNVQVIVWLAIFAERDPSLLDRMRARLRHLLPESRSRARG